jgi:Serine/Threonine/Tyrosine Kinase found in polyvalent proteins
MGQRRRVGDKIVLETTTGNGKLPALPNDPKRDRNPETETRKLPGTNQDRTLAEASYDARSVLRADGTINGDEDGLDLIRRQLESLALEAERKGRLYAEPDQLRIGGVEHDVLPDPESGTILKFTKQDRAAYAVNFDLGTPRMEPALPLEYLDRLMLQNEIFGDNLRFVGIVGRVGNRRIVTRQDLVEGRPARWEEIILMMNDLGFTKLRHNHGIGYENSYAFVRDDAVVFDLRPANVFVTDDGIIVPIDSIPVKLPSGKRAFFDT